MGESLHKLAPNTGEGPTRNALYAANPGDAASRTSESVAPGYPGLHRRRHSEEGNPQTSSATTLHRRRGLLQGPRARGSLAPTSSLPRIRAQACSPTPRGTSYQRIGPSSTPKVAERSPLLCRILSISKLSVTDNREGRTSSMASFSHTGTRRRGAGPPTAAQAISFPTSIHCGPELTGQRIRMPVIADPAGVVNSSRQGLPATGASMGGAGAAASGSRAAALAALSRARRRAPSRSRSLLWRSF